ncbi:hypothetical protein W97_07943 [Coniosporium apollinis CBS 100218]|uniref:Uncharacterized protein n=1 Tax=Coniosporium apollinis (strain CBS 100218) TaxID=1168221 RepID=R7Z3C1_CONA1|nr:uncharacterized protein W97_07943 [Coniosporium apollinis CBS 100218]EON68685.1 hypothetical protein W97_07943 [Coniosporium apollinis CBS 100218]
MLYHSLPALLRAVGLDVISSLFFNSKEPKKPVIVQSVWIASSRCAVHLLPALVSIVIIALNLQTYFIGFQLAGIPDTDRISMAALQVTAKLQELLIVASVGAIIHHQLRSCLHDSQGLPFGLLGSGLSFTQVSFFWSQAFVGSLTQNVSLPLLCLLIVGGVIASTAGPATAVLLIPRQISYPAGQTSYYVNGMSEDLWPQHLGLVHYLPNYTNLFGESIDCASNRGFISAVCPSGGYASLMGHFSANPIQHLPNPGFSFSRIDRPREFYSLFPSGNGILVKSRQGHTAPQTLSGNIRTPLDISETFTYATHGATANLQRRINLDWLKAVNEVATFYHESIQAHRFQFYTTQRTTVSSSVPVRIWVRASVDDRSHLELKFENDGRPEDSLGKEYLEGSFG